MLHPWLVFVLICGTYISSTYSGSTYIGDPAEGFYWRDYTGEIPSDALPGGVKPDEHAAYIGQVIYRHKGIAIPGKIDGELLGYMYFEYANEGQVAYISNSNIKILCTQHPQDFNWIPAKADDTVTSVVKDGGHIIIAGIDESYSVAVGRKPLSADIGKILVMNSTFEGLHISPNGRNGRKEREFDILVYKPSTKNGIVVTGEGETVNIIIA